MEEAMKISPRTSQTPAQVEIGTVASGRVFEYAGVFFMKTASVGVAANLETGVLRTFGSGEMVLVYPDAELHPMSPR
jgi:hypothetical protein